MESKKENGPNKLNSVGRRLNHATRLTVTLAQCQLDTHGLTMQYWVLLTALWQCDGLTISEVAKYYNVNTPAASRLIDRMERDGWIYKKAHEIDKRSSVVLLTEKAKEKSHLLDMYRDINNIAMHGFTTDEVITLYGLLERVATNATSAIKDSKSNG